MPSSNYPQQTQRVLVLGGTGFVGQAIVRALIAAGLRPILLVRPQSVSRAEKMFPRQQVEMMMGTPADLPTLTRQLSFLSPIAVIYAIGLVREFPRRRDTFIKAHYDLAETALAAAQASGIPHFIYISANGVEANLTAYQRTKLKFEQHLLAQKDVDFTIIRPSIVWDQESSMFSMYKLLRQLTRLPVVPVIGRGEYRLAPVARSDLAAAVVKLTVAARHNRNRVYTLCGPQSYSFKELLQRVRFGGRTSGRLPIVFIPLPVKFLLFWGKVFKYQRWFPFTDDQIRMLVADNACENSSKTWKEIGHTPTNIFP